MVLQRMGQGTKSINIVGQHRAKEALPEKVERLTGLWNGCCWLSRGTPRPRPVLIAAGSWRGRQVDHEQMSLLNRCRLAADSSASWQNLLFLFFRFHILILACVVVVVVASVVAAAAICLSWCLVWFNDCVLRFFFERSCMYSMQWHVTVQLVCGVHRGLKQTTQEDSIAPHVKISAANEIAQQREDSTHEFLIFAHDDRAREVQTIRVRPIKVFQLLLQRIPTIPLIYLLIICEQGKKRILMRKDARTHTHSLVYTLYVPLLEATVRIQDKWQDSTAVMTDDKKKFVFTVSQSGRSLRSAETKDAAASLWPCTLLPRKISPQYKLCDG